MISYGDMLDTLEKNSPQNPPTVAEKKGGVDVPKTEEPKMEEPKTEEPKTEEPKKEEPKVEDVI